MTVYELIKRLAKYSPDSRVYTYDDGDVFEVEGVGIDDEKLIIGCGCGSEGIRIVFPGEDYTSPIVDEKEKD